jgi:autotransporter-associated beta strand protein
VAALITALFATVLLGGTSVQAVSYWIAKSEADWFASTTNWVNGMPTGTAGTSQVVFTNGVPCDFGSVGYSTDSVGIALMNLGPSNKTTGILNMTNGILMMTNSSAIEIILGGTGASATTTTGSNSVGTFNMIGGTLYVAKSSSANEWQNQIILGMGTNSTGTFTLNGGTANCICGIQTGINGPGTLNVNGGTMIVNSYFEVGAGGGVTNVNNTYSPGSGTFNLTGGGLYILRNDQSTPCWVSPQDGLAINQSVTNAVVNISGGTLYCHQIGLDAYTGIPSTGSSDTLNISGGTIYLGDGGVNSNSYAGYTVVGNGLISQAQSVNISGGTFHTLDMLWAGLNNGTYYTNYYTNQANPSIVITSISSSTNGNGNTNTILADGTNWTWAVDPPVNLTNSSFPVIEQGVTNYGPGYVTFAPETNRVITLSNVWSGVGGITVTNSTGSGQVILAGANTYTGNTTVSGGELSLSGGGTISSTNIIVANGATFDVSGLTSTFLLASGQTLSNSSSTAILNGSAGSGSGTISLTYASGTPSFVVANGTLTLSAGTVFNVNNTGSALGPGTYTLIGTSGGGVVVGPVPSSYVVGGNGVKGTHQYSLGISSSNTLDLTVSNRAPVIANSVTNTVTYNSTWQIAISSLSNSAAWSDPDGDTVTLSSVGPFSANDVSVTNNSTSIYYTAPVTASDNFSYIVTDGTLTATGTVYLLVPWPPLSPIISNPPVNGSGNPTFSGTGASVNCTYGVESTTSLSGSQVWIEAGTTTTDGTGSWSFTDITQTNPPTIFYRLYNLSGTLPQ